MAVWEAKQVGKHVEKPWKNHGKTMENHGRKHGKPWKKNMEKLWKNHGKIMEHMFIVGTWQFV